MHDEPFKVLFPALTDAERETAREALDRYLELAWEIWVESQGKETPD
jgi:hypothetical protein